MIWNESASLGSLKSANLHQSIKSLSALFHRIKSEYGGYMNLPEFKITNLSDSTSYIFVPPLDCKSFFPNMRLSPFPNRFDSTPIPLRIFHHMPTMRRPNKLLFRNLIPLDLSFLRMCFNMLPEHHIVRTTIKIQPRRRLNKQRFIIQLPPKNSKEVFPARNLHHDNIPAHEKMQEDVAQPAQNERFGKRHRQRQDRPAILPLPGRTILDLSPDGEVLSRTRRVFSSDIAGGMRAAVGEEFEQDLLVRRSGEKDLDHGLDAREFAFWAIEGHFGEGSRDEEEARVRIQRFVPFRVLGDVLREGVEPGAQENEVWRGFPMFLCG